MGSGQEYIVKGGSVETAQRVGRVVRQQCYPALCMPPSLWEGPCSAVTEAGCQEGWIGKSTVQARMVVLASYITSPACKPCVYVGGPGQKMDPVNSFVPGRVP